MAPTELIKVATYNAAYFRDPKRGAPGDYRLLFTEADVVGFQEAGRNIDKKQINAVADSMGFGVYFDPKEGGTPIAWNESKFKFIKGGSVFLSPRTFVGEEGAGPNTMGEKNHVWVKLRHKPTGRIFYFGTDHLTPSIHLVKRRRLHVMQTNRIRDWFVKTKNLIITVGDYNIDATKDMKEKKPAMPFIKFKRVGVTNTYKALGLPPQGTHGKRHIDYVWFRIAEGRLEAVSHYVIGKGLSSDHRALVAEFKVTLTPFKRAQRRLRRLRKSLTRS